MDNHRMHTKHKDMLRSASQTEPISSAKPSLFRGALFLSVQFIHSTNILSAYCLLGTVRNAGDVLLAEIRNM